MRLARLALFLCSLLVSLALAEGFLRLWSPGRAFNTTFALYPHYKRTLRVTKQGQTRVITQTTNRWGFRGDEPPSDWAHTYSIVAIGGSTTQCYYLDDRETWPYKLQEHLRRTNPRVWVGNAGLDGHTTIGHLELMKKVISVIRPKAVVVLVGINDAAMALHPSVYVFDDPGRWTWRLYRKSRLANLFYTWYLILARNVHRVKDSPLNYVPQVLHEKALEPSEKGLAKPLAAYQQRLREMIHLARSYSTTIFFLTQPVLWDDTPFWRAHEGGFYWVNDPTKVYSAATCSRIIKRYNLALMSVCRQERVSCYDLASAVPHSETYFYDSAHFNEAGTSRVADRVAEFLKSAIPRS
jgi:lysophospholipase L1-like esterase